MKVIDAMQKITNGEEFRFKILSENKTYHVYKDSQIFDEEDEDYVQWFIDYDWLNEEVEILEEENELHANSVEFNINNDKRDCIITLDENDLGIDKLHLDNCYFYKENGKWYVKKYDFKTINIEEDEEIRKLATNFSIRATDGQMIMVVYKVNEIIDKINEMREDK